MLKYRYIEPPESERQYRDLALLGAKLRVPISEAFLSVAVLDKNGKPLSKPFKQRSHSWTRNFYNVIAVQTLQFVPNDANFGAGFLNIKIIAGTTTKGAAGLAMTNTSDDPTLVGNGYRANLGVVGQNGIVVGSGADPESFEDYKLKNQINHGTSAGQLSYQAGELPIRSYDAGTKTMSVVHTRYMNNNSGGDITVAETGLVSYCRFDSYANQFTLISRDLLSPAVVVPNSGQLKVDYTLSIVYPA